MSLPSGVAWTFLQAATISSQVVGGCDAGGFQQVRAVVEQAAVGGDGAAYSLSRYFVVSTTGFSIWSSGNSSRAAG